MPRDKRLEIARLIVTAKLRTLGLHPADAEAFRVEIARARSVLDLMAAEARAGGAYFMRYRGAELRIRGDVPDHWRTFIVRAAPALKGLIGTSKARNAATPIGALLNYVYAVALGQCTRASLGSALILVLGSCSFRDRAACRCPMMCSICSARI